MAWNRTLFPSSGFGSNSGHADWRFAYCTRLVQDAAVPGEGQKKMLIAAAVTGVALSLPLALAVVGGAKMWREARQSAAEAPESAALREAAERAAEVALPLPTLAADAEILQCAPDKFESEVQRVVRLGEGVGGVASSWNDGQSIRLIAKIPVDAEVAFRNAVNEGIYDLRIAATTTQTTIVEVVIKPRE
ncbi:MAG: hypothetical protein ACO3XN_06930 [Chthoniobacterales bacterium]